MELSLDDIAKHLGVALDTVQRWVRQGKLPVQRKGRKYSFRIKDLQRWASKNNLVLSFDKNGDEEKQNDGLPSLSEMINKGGIYYNVPGDSIDSVLKASLDRITNIPSELKKELLSKLLERENVVSTGVGNGIAIPHPRVQPESLDKSIMSVCFLENAIDYNAMDNQPVNALFILLCQSLEIHLHALSTLSFCLRNNQFSEFIKTAPDQASILAEVEKFQGEMA